MGVSRLTERLAHARTVWAMLRPSECGAVPNAPSPVMSSPCAKPRLSLNLAVPPTERCRSFVYDWMRHMITSRITNGVLSGATGETQSDNLPLHGLEIGQ